MCTADCIGSCEIGLSAVRGMETVYPTTTGENQIASEKVYPVDYSHFNINGRAFGAMGALLDADRATIYHVGLEREIGTLNPVKLALPIILPALIKLNWPDYFGGAAMAGVNAVIGEGAVSKDPTLAYENGKVVHAPKLREMLDAFNKYDRGYGQIILQANYDDDAQGVPEYAIRECGAKAIEFKFGQSAKGTQPANLVPTLEEALKKCGQGFLVLPDPRDPCVQEAYGRKACPAFHVYGRLPIWSNDYLIGRIAQLRDMGMTNVYFKMAGFDPEDLEHVLRLASKAQVDMVTFDGAGGGSGYSPCKMMNEWCLPTVVMESILYGILDKLAAEGMELPDVAITAALRPRIRCTRRWPSARPTSPPWPVPVQHGGGHERQKDRGSHWGGQSPPGTRPFRHDEGRAVQRSSRAAGALRAARRTGSPPGPSGYIPTATASPTAAPLRRPEQEIRRKAHRAARRLPAHPRCQGTA